MPDLIITNKPDPISLSDLSNKDIETLQELQMLFEKEIMDLRNPFQVIFCMSSVLIVCILAKLCGYTTSKEIEVFWENNLKWIEDHLFFMQGVAPCADTISYVLKNINHDQLQRLVLLRFAERYSLAEIIPGFDEEFSVLGFRILDADGQTVTSTNRSNKNKNGKRCGGFDIVTIMDASTKAALIQLIVDKKNQEATSILKMLTDISLDGAILTFDAINTRLALLAAIVMKGGHYFCNLKFNQKNACEEAITSFEILDNILDTKIAPTSWEGHKHAAFASSTQNTGGETVDKELIALPASDVFSSEVLAKWKDANLQTVIRVNTKRYNKASGKMECGDLYFITDLPIIPDDCESKSTAKLNKVKNGRAKEFLTISSLKWSVETMHQHLDNPKITNQDNHRIFNKQLLAGHTILNKFVLNILKKVQKVSVVMHKDGLTYREDRLPVTQLVYKADKAENAFSYLRFYFTGDKDGLRNMGICPPLPTVTEHQHENTEAGCFTFVSEEDKGFPLAQIFADGGGRAKRYKS